MLDKDDFILFYVAFASVTENYHNKIVNDFANLWVMEVVWTHRLLLSCCYIQV